MSEFHVKSLEHAVFGKSLDSNNYPIQIIIYTVAWEIALMHVYIRLTGRA